MTVRIAILGPAELRDASGMVLPLRGTRLRQLLIRLAVEAGQPVSAEGLAADLWSGDPPAEPANALQGLVSRLRRAAGGPLVELGPGGYRLAVAPGDIDAGEFGRLAAEGRAALTGGDPEQAGRLLIAAERLWRGDALDGARDAPFAAAPAARLEQLRLAAAEDRFEAELACGRGAGVAGEAEVLSAAQPLRERLRGLALRALCAAGRQADALAAFEQTRRLLAVELGVDPSPALAAIYLDILRGTAAESGPADGPLTGERRPDVPAGRPLPDRAAGTGTGHADQAETASQQSDRAAGGALAPRRAGRETKLSNLPAQLTSFVGRDAEIAELSELLRRARLVTLTGPGGAGKTRLSVEVSARQVSQLADGAWFVPLAGLRDGLDLAPAVLTALGVNDAALAETAEARLAAQPPADRLADLLAARDLLLVLDNCEHVIDAAAGLAGQLLAQAPGVRILATSREPLGITGETLWPVMSLSLPPAAASAAEAAGHASVALLADRAAAVRPGFGVTGQNVAALVRICRALDGIPLAIELAAARLRSLSPAQVADRLDDRFRLLSVGSRNAMPQHQTLRAIVDWSWELLRPAEQSVLARLSVFAGGATPEAAEQVAALGGGPGGAAGPGDLIGPDDVIDLVASLADKSLVVVTGDGEVRYRLLETVRAYAAERLAAAGEQDAARARHARYFLDLAERADPQLRARDQARWLRRLTAEHDNCTAALRHAVAGRDTVTAVRLVGALSWFWVMRDYGSEAGLLAEPVLALAGDEAPAGLDDQYAICVLLAAMGQATSSDEPGQETFAAAVARIAELTQHSEHPTLMLVGPVLAMISGDLAAVRRKLSAMRNPGPWTSAARRMMLGHLAMEGADLEQAATDFTAAYAAFTAIGDRWGLITTLRGLAEIAMARGEPAAAVRALEEARSYADGGLATSWSELMNIPLGRARASAGDVATGRAEIERAVEFARGLGEPDNEISGYIELAELARREGQLGRARGLLEQALAVAGPVRGRPDVTLQHAIALTRLGCVAEQDGDLAAAADWHGQALSALRSTPSIPPGGPVVGVVVEGLAALAAARGEPDRAAELLGHAHALRGFRDPESLEVARAEAVARAAGGFDPAYQRGLERNRAQALALLP